MLHLHAREFVPLALLVCALLLPASQLRADGGEGAGVGLVIAYSDNRSWSLGWEAGATQAGPLFKFSAGGSYRIGGDPRDPLAIHYLVFEPWLLVGGTLGIALADGPEARLAYGVWEGFALPLEGDLFGGDNSDDIHPQAWLFTFAFGYRGFGATHQFYFTPKFWRLATIELNS